MSRSRRLLRALLLLLVLGGAVFVVERSWVAFVPVLKPVARDYLSFRRVRKFRDVLLAAAEESRVDPYLLAAVMVVESGGRVDARSSADALGLFQLTMTTADWRARQMGLPPPTEEELLSDPMLNARLGADNLAWLLDTYEQDVERALIAYNAGAGRLAQLVREAGDYESWREERLAAGDSQLFGYAHRVLDYRRRFREEGLFEKADRTPIRVNGAR